MADFVWKNLGCFECNNPKCRWKMDGEIVCPQRDRPGVRDRVLRNFRKMKGKRGENQKREDEYVGFYEQEAESHHDFSIHANAEAKTNFEAHMAARRRERYDNEGVTLKREEDGTPNSTVMGAFACLNANPGGPCLLPVYVPRC